MIGASPSDGSSTSRSLGLPTNARPIASICCSPPDNVLPSCERRSPRRGKSRHTRSSCRRRSAPLCQRVNSPSMRFSSTLRVAKMRRSSGMKATPLRKMRSGDKPADRFAREPDGALRRAQPAHDRAQRRGLARAVAAEDADDLARVDLERDALEHRRVVIARMQAVDLKQRHGRPRDRLRGRADWHAPVRAGPRTACAPGA